MRRLSLLLALMSVLVSASYSFAEPTFGLSAFTGFQGYQMGQINTAINDIQDALSEPANRAEIDNLTGSWNYGGALQVDFNPKLRAYLEYEHLSDKTGFGNNLGSFHLEPNADALLVGGTYFFPSTSKTRFGLGGGVGFYSFAGSANSTITWYTTTSSAAVDLSGDAVGIFGRGEAEVSLAPLWRMGVAIGYRSAQGALKVDGEDSGIDLDWSGLMTRLGITFVMGGP
jgi:hypothetical protein